MCEFVYHESVLTIHKTLDVRMTLSFWMQMSFGNFLYRKADEYAHNEIMSFFVIILGMTMLVGGLLITLIVIQEPEWLLFIPYQQYMNNIGILGFVFSLTGLVCLAIGFIMVAYYDRKKSWVLGQLDKSNPDQKNARSELKLDRLKKVLEEHSREK